MLARMTPFETALDEIDALHREDPARRELDYAERMTRWLDRLDAAPDPLLVLAVRAQHLKRWERPRGDYPTGRAGYLKWRRDAAAHHARLVAEVLARAGYAPDACARVVDLVQKRDLSRDALAQTLEDCACLVFFETELAAFAAKQPAEKVADVLAKTWRKMSPRARALARPLLPAGTTPPDD